jgi:hypothetical protein
MLRRLALVVMLVTAGPGDGGIRAAPLQHLVPDPTECTGDRRPLAFCEQLVDELATQTGANPPDTAPPPPRDPAPANPATLAAIEATVRGVVACNNSGDYLAWASFFTERYHTWLYHFGTPGPPTCEGDARECYSAGLNPAPSLPAEESMGVVSIEDVTVGADGRVEASITLRYPSRRLSSPGYEEILHWTSFVQRDGRYLIDADEAPDTSQLDFSSQLGQRETLGFQGRVPAYEDSLRPSAETEIHLDYYLQLERFTLPPGADGLLEGLSTVVGAVETGSIKLTALSGPVTDGFLEELGPGSAVDCGPGEKFTLLPFGRAVLRNTGDGTAVVLVSALVPAVNAGGCGGGCRVFARSR